MFFIIVFVSCGKTNQINSNGSVSGFNTFSATNSQFIGVYDLIQMRNNDECGASIRIVADCNGLKLLSNNSEAEEFCNINQGEANNRNNSTTVTLQGNQLQSVVRISDDNRNVPGRPGPGGINERQMAFTNTLTLNSDGTILTKVSDLKSRSSRCTYQKR